MTTTHSVEKYEIIEYKGVKIGEVIVGANIFRDIFASITDIVGGRSGAYESKLGEARQAALKELQDNAKSVGANAVVGIDLDYEVVNQSMLMVSASGTAVVIKPTQQ